MRVLVACEYSARVRDAFRRHGHDAWSCDLLDCEADPRWHLQQPVEEVLGNDWDLLVAHPPCTHLAVSGAKHFAAKQASGVQQEALQFVRRLLDAPVPKIALENPISIISSCIRKPDQIIQPYQFGHDASKKTCLWLKGLPLLKPTQMIAPRIVNGKQRWANQTDSGQNKLPPSKDRWKLRSKTYEGIADAMAAQWG
jgi:hypothetical protein